MPTKLVTPALQPQKTSKKGWLTLGIIFGALILLIALVVLYVMVIQPALAPKQSLTLTPDRALIGDRTVSDDSLEETAKVLRLRWSLLGYGNPLATFSVSTNGTIVAKVPANISQDFIQRTRTTGVLEFVDFGAHAMQPGEQVNTDYNYGFAPGDGTQWHTIMTGGQIKTIAAYLGSDGSYQIAFSLTDKGKQVLSDYTTQNIGSYLGIVLDRSVIACPQIGSPVVNGAGVINGHFTKQQADIFVAVIRAGPLTIPLK